MAKKLKELFKIMLTASKEFRRKEITLTVTSKPENLIGKKFYVNLADLTGDFNKYYIKIYFRIVNVEGEKALTEFDGIECLREYISRLVHRRITRIDVIKDSKTKDNVWLRIKVIIITHKKIKGSQKTAIRKELWKVIDEYVSSVTLSEFVKKSVIGDELKNKLIEATKKIYPPKSLEIRKIERLWNKR